MQNIMKLRFWVTLFCTNVFHNKNVPKFKKYLERYKNVLSAFTIRYDLLQTSDWTLIELVISVVNDNRNLAMTKYFVGSIL